MSIVSLSFLGFVIIGLILYYLFPLKHRWVVLLALSYAFYAIGNFKTIIYLILTTASTFFVGKKISNITKKDNNKHKKSVLVLLACLFNFGMLFFFKYWDFVAKTINGVIGGERLSVFNLVLPLGISFYIFQSIGYIIDLYRGKYDAERNIFKYALFVSYFPQITQGPINRFKELSSQLYKGNSFDFDNFKLGIQTVMLGLFKKLIIADRTAILVNAIIPNYDKYDGGVILVAMIFYCIQLYMDFSGGIDIVTGVSNMFGIRMAQNFNRPIFATSLTDFWRRWHMSLGAWMKDYLFYPISLSKTFIKLGKFVRKHVKGKAGKIIPVSIATFIVYFAIGIWHGSSFKYIAFGFWNGLLITASLLLEPLFIKIKQKAKIEDSNKLFRLFRQIRTAIIVLIGRYITRAPRFLSAIEMLKITIFGFSLKAINDGVLLNLGLNSEDFIIILVGTLILLIIEALYENGFDVGKWIDKKHTIIQVFAMIIVVCVVLHFGVFRGDYIASEFIYKNY